MPSSNRYPDGGSCAICQRQVDYPIDFCEVKAAFMKNDIISTHLKLFKLYTFGDTFDNEAVNNVVSVQTVCK